jgi:hypothetical protein
VVDDHCMKITHVIRGTVSIQPWKHTANIDSPGMDDLDTNACRPV